MIPSLPIQKPSLLNFVPYVLSCLTCSRIARASCLLGSHVPQALRAVVHHVARALRTVCRASGASYLTFSCDSRALCPTCSRAWCALCPTWTCSHGWRTSCLICSTIHHCDMQSLLMKQFAIFKPLKVH